MAKKRRARFDSVSTPGHKQDTAQYIVELNMMRKNRGPLPQYFWRQQRFKWNYSREIKAVKHFTKKYGESKALRIALQYPLVTWTKYADVEVHFQRLEELEKLRALPKDTSEVKKENEMEAEDLRDFSPKSKVFRLSQIRSGDG